jgi:hypothetical protein
MAILEERKAVWVATDVYDAFENLAAEWGTVASAACTTCYLSYDHLGSVRLVTDQNANVVTRHDYLPFGEEIPANRSKQPMGLDGGRGAEVHGTDPG